MCRRLFCVSVVLTPETDFVCLCTLFFVLCVSVIAVLLQLRWIVMCTRGVAMHKN